jgi:hypothetical protein
MLSDIRVAALGTMQFVVIPKGPRAFAVLQVNPRIPALAVAYAVTFGIPLSAPLDMKIRLPDCWGIITRAAAFAHEK